MENLNHYRFVELFTIAEGNVRLATRLYHFSMKDFPQYDPQATPDDIRNSIRTTPSISNYGIMKQKSPHVITSTAFEKIYDFFELMYRFLGDEERISEAIQESLIDVLGVKQEKLEKLLRTYGYVDKIQAEPTNTCFELSSLGQNGGGRSYKKGDPNYPLR